MLLSPSTSVAAVKLARCSLSRMELAERQQHRARGAPTSAHVPRYQAFINKKIPLPVHRPNMSARQSCAWYVIGSTSWYVLEVRAEKESRIVQVQGTGMSPGRRHGSVLDPEDHPPAPVSRNHHLFAGIKNSKGKRHST